MVCHITTICSNQTNTPSILLLRKYTSFSNSDKSNLKKRQYINIYSSYLNNFNIEVHMEISHSNRTVSQQLIFYDPKGKLLQSKRSCFGLQNMTFCNTADYQRVTS